MAKIFWRLIACEDNWQSWGVVAFGAAGLVYTALQQTQKERRFCFQCFNIWIMELQFNFLTLEENQGSKKEKFLFHVVTCRTLQISNSPQICPVRGELFKWSHDMQIGIYLYMQRDIEDREGLLVPIPIRAGDLKLPACCYVPWEQNGTGPPRGFYPTESL